MFLTSLQDCEDFDMCLDCFNLVGSSHKIHKVVRLDQQSVWLWWGLLVMGESVYTTHVNRLRWAAWSWLFVLHKFGLDDPDYFHRAEPPGVIDLLKTCHEQVFPNMSVPARFIFISGLQRLFLMEGETESLIGCGINALHNSTRSNLFLCCLIYRKRRELEHAEISYHSLQTLCVESSSSTVSLTFDSGSLPVVIPFSASVEGSVASSSLQSSSKHKQVQGATTKLLLLDNAIIDRDTVTLRLGIMKQQKKWMRDHIGKTAGYGNSAWTNEDRWKSFQDFQIRYRGLRRDFLTQLLSLLSTPENQVTKWAIFFERWGTHFFLSESYGATRVLSKENHFDEESSTKRGGFGAQQVKGTMSKSVQNRISTTENLHVERGAAVWGNEDDKSTVVTAQALISRELVPLTSLFYYLSPYRLVLQQHIDEYLTSYVFVCFTTSNIDNNLPYVLDVHAIQRRGTNLFASPPLKCNPTTAAVFRLIPLKSHSNLKNAPMLIALESVDTSMNGFLAICNSAQ